MFTRRTFVKSTLAAGALAACGGKTKSQPATPVVTKPAPQKILILGGTQFLGPELVAAAQAHGHTLTLFNRGKTHPELFPDVEKLRGDRKDDLKSLEGRQWDAVIDTSGYFPKHVKASAELLAPNVKQYVFISTISVYADFNEAGMDETYPVGKIDNPDVETIDGGSYGPLKALCEQAAEAAMPGRVTNIRPGLIVGPGDPTDRYTYWPVRIARGGEVLAPGTGDDPVQYIDVRDLAEWTIRLVEARTFGLMNALGPASRLTMKEMLAAIAAGVGSQPTFTWVDAKFLEQQQVSPWMDMPVWVPNAEGAGFGDMSNARATAAGLTFRAPEDTAKATIDWWNAQPDERKTAPLKAGLTAERETAVLDAWKAITHQG